MKMMTFTRAVFALALLVAATATQAVPFVLPSGFAQAKLSGPIPMTYAVVCDSLTDVPCDVAPGRYQLQTFDGAWMVTQRKVTVSEPGEPLDGAIAIVRRDCDASETGFIGGYESIVCEARCSANSTPIATQCGTSQIPAGVNIANVLIENYNGRCHWRSPASQSYFAVASCIVD